MAFVVFGCLVVWCELDVMKDPPKCEHFSV